MADRIRVLFIDDDSSMQVLATGMLSTKQFEVLAVPDTASADKVLAERRVDVIVCDLMMPNENGFQFYERMKARGLKTPFLFLSAVGDPRTVRQGIDSGANDYLVKPFDVLELARRIASLAASSAPGRSPGARA